MSIIREIHEQPEWVRASLFVLSCVVVLSLVTYTWFLSFERETFLALNPGPEGEEQLAQLQDRGPGPLALVSRGLGSAAASIGSLIGLDTSEGFDIGDRNGDNHDRTYLLPLSD
jgi:hypothetical protein